MKTMKEAVRFYRFSAVVLLVCYLLLPNDSSGQNVSKDYTNQTKTTQVDTLWGANNSTPDSVAYNVFSRPNIVKTYGKEGDNPTMNWEAMTPSEKSAYFKEIMNKFRRLYPNYNVVNNNGDTILQIDGANCYDYNNWAAYGIEGENNMINDKGSSLNWSPSIRDINLNHNGEFNLPYLYITDISGDSINGYVDHAVSGIYLKDKITQNTNLKDDFETIDSRTGYSAASGTPFMVDKTEINGKTNVVGILWNGYSGGNFVQYKLMDFQFDQNGNSYLTFINPKFRTIDKSIISLTVNSLNDTVVKPNTDLSKLEKFVVSTNENLNTTIHTDDGNNTVDMSYYLDENETIDTIYKGEKADTLLRKFNVNFMQKGTMSNAIGSKSYLTTLKSAQAQQKIIVDKNTTGINDHEAQSEKYGIQKAWPNPVNSGQHLMLEYHAQANGPVHFKIFTLSGREVFTYTTTISQQTQQVELPLSPLPAGTYLVKSKGQVVKVVVE